jgi:hypothetical protein
MSIHSNACDAPPPSDSERENIQSEQSWPFNTHDAATFELDNRLANPTGFDIPHVTPNDSTFFTLPVLGDMSTLTPSEHALFNDWVNPQYLVSQFIYPS